MYGAMIAITISSSTNTAAIIAMCCRLNLRQNSVHGVRISCGAVAALSAVTLIASSLEANGRIDDRVQHVHDQIDHDELQREQQHLCLNHGIVAHLDGIDEQAAKARPVEHLLDDDRAAEQKAELQ